MKKKKTIEKIEKRLKNNKNTQDKKGRLCMVNIHNIQLYQQCAEKKISKETIKQQNV